MSARMDEAFANFNANVENIKATLSSATTEADARFRSIDEMLKNVLKWQNDKVKCEPRTNAGFADYTLHGVDGRTLGVVEAKKSSALPLGTTDVKFSHYQLSGPVLKPLSKVIEQVTGYCLSKGTPLACVTDGNAWIFFRALRTDGLDASLGTAIVFPNLDAVGNHFSVFFDLISHYGITNGLALAQINKAEGIRGNPAEHHFFVKNPEEGVLGQRSELARDLVGVFREFFSKMSSDNAEMMRQCFVDSRESVEASNQLERIVSQLTDDIQSLDTKHGEQLVEELKHVIKNKRSEIVLIVGNKGSGKSTFIDRFFAHVLSPAIRNECAVCVIDVSSYPGGNTDIQRWMSLELIEALEKHVFEDEQGVGETGDYQGLFFSTYQRWSRATFKDLYETDKVAFKVKFGEHVESMRRDHPQEYVLDLLRQFSHSRKKLPCIIYDNTDQFPSETQNLVFQYAVALRKAVTSFGIVPITDRSIWRLSKAGPIQSEVSHTFYLPVPDPTAIIRKRVQFVRDMITSDEKNSGEYFAGKGIRISIKNLQAFAEIVEKAFLTSTDVTELVGALANFEIRRILEIAERILLSHSFKIDDLFKIYIANQDNLYVDYNKVVKALLIGNYDRFTESASSYVANLFSVDPLSPESPLIRLYLLDHLNSIREASSTVEDRYVQVVELLAHFEQIGASRENIIRILKHLFEFRLIESFDGAEEEISVESRVGCTPSGAVHLALALTNPAYLEEMACVTGLRTKGTVDQLDQLRFRMRDSKARLEFFHAFASYIYGEDGQKAHLPSAETFRNLLNVRRGFKARWMR